MKCLYTVLDYAENKEYRGLTRLQIEKTIGCVNPSLYMNRKLRYRGKWGIKKYELGKTKGFKTATEEEIKQIIDLVGDVEEEKEDNFTKSWNDMRAAAELIREGKARIQKINGKNVTVIKEEA